MTRDEALARITAIEEGDNVESCKQHADDARKLVAMLPDRLLEKLQERWIRCSSEEPKSLEFFWSRAISIFNPGNRIITFLAKGSGKFAVAVRGGNGGFDKWQRDEDGQPIPGVLTLGADGDQALIDAMAQWQVPVKESADEPQADEESPPQ